MDIRYLEYTEKCPICGTSALTTDGTIVFCTVIIPSTDPYSKDYEKCGWIKPYKTESKIS
jgi:hypothetical protein